MTLLRCALWLTGLRLICAVKRVRTWLFRASTWIAAPLVALLDADQQQQWVAARTAVGDDIHRRHIARLVRWLERRPIRRRPSSAPSAEGLATMGQPGESE